MFYKVWASSYFFGIFVSLIFDCSSFSDSNRFLGSSLNSSTMSVQKVASKLTKKESFYKIFFKKLGSLSENFVEQ